MRPFYLIVTTYADGVRGSSDPFTDLDDAANEFAEIEKLPHTSRRAVMVDLAARAATDVTGLVEKIIALREMGRDAA
jgi:hypothetical protein